MLINACERAGIYTALIRNKTPLDKLDFGLLRKAAAYTAFPRETRKRDFGGLV